MEDFRHEEPDADQKGYQAASDKTVHNPTEIDRILAIAKSLPEKVELGDDGDCIKLAKALCRELNREGYKAKTVRGKFRMDRPYTKWGTQPDPCTAIHQWVEIDGLIVDVTAAQFNEYLDEAASQIMIGTYKELRRYEKT